MWLGLKYKIHSKWSGQSSICVSLVSLKQLLLGTWFLMLRYEQRGSSALLSAASSLSALGCWLCNQLWLVRNGTAPVFLLICQVTLSSWCLCHSVRGNCQYAGLKPHSSTTACCSPLPCVFYGKTEPSWDSGNVCASPGLNSPEDTAELPLGGLPYLRTQVNSKHVSGAERRRLNYVENWFEELLEDEFEGTMIGDEQVCC